MEATREIYWNVGHGFNTLGPMYASVIIAIGILAYGIYKRLLLYRLGKPLNRFDEPMERVKMMLKYALLQTKVLRVPGSGYAHGLFLWSFVLLFIGTLLIVVQADITALLFDIHFLKGVFYLLFSVILDIAGLIAIVMLLGLFVRRYIVKPEGLLSSKDDLIMHILLLAIFITGFMIEGCRMAVTEVGTNDSLTLWSPVGLLVAKTISHLDATTLLSFHIGLWWFHLLLAMVFIAIIPYTKFRHLLTTSINGYFTDRGPTGNLTTLNLEDESNENFGAKTITDFTWKDLFDTDACTLCKRCQDRCPAWNTEKPLSPMQVITELGLALSKETDRGLQDAITRDAIWTCTTCRACQDICPANIEHVNKIVELRRNLVLMEGEFPGEEVMAAVEQTEVNGNPLGMGYASRGDWCEQLGTKTLAEDADVDILYFVGCYASFDKRNIKVAKDFIRLCQVAGISVGILGKEEKCCGEPTRKMGNEYLYQTLAMENIEIMNGYEVKKVVTSCPHCFNTLSKDYRDLGFTAEVVSYVTFLEELVITGKLKINAYDFTCTYHDSCYLGRYNDIYAAPRALIKAVGGTIVEIEKNHDQSFCCGAGGGRILAEEKLGSRINIKRVRMAAATEAPMIISNCPFCLTMFEDGVKSAELDGKLVPRDIAEILAERLV